MSAIQQMFLGNNGIPRNGLVAEYLLASNSNDTSGNGNNGTDTSITYSSGSAVFNGSSSVISLPSVSQLKPTGVFSISLWVKTTPGANGAYPTFIQSYSQVSTVAGFEIMQNPPDHPSKPNCLRFIIGKNTGFTAGTDWQEAFSTNAITDNTWQHIYCEYNGTTIIVYQNNSAGTSQNWNQGLAYTATSYQRIGAANHSGSDFWFTNGNIKKARIYDRALNSTEIALLYADS